MTENHSIDLGRLHIHDSRAKQFDLYIDIDAIGWFGHHHDLNVFIHSRWVQTSVQPSPVSWRR